MLINFYPIVGKVGPDAQRKSGNPQKSDKLFQKKATAVLKHSTKQSLIVISLLIFLFCACAPHFESAPESKGKAGLTDAVFTSFDATELPLRTWLPTTPLKAVIIALHGYNDYGNFIKDAAAYFQKQGIGVYAYDQRGFGATNDRGRWAGRPALEKDLRTIIDLVKTRHPKVPLYLLGHSMGAAVILAADRPENPLPCAGVVLAAPAVWSRNTMPFYQRWLLWLAAHTIPWVRLSGQDLHITASDNKEMLRAQGRDPLVLKESRIDAIYGLANLMDAAFEAAARFDRKVLFLYGEKDEVIPQEPMVEVFRKRLRGRFSNPQRILIYKNGYHMLLRDLQAEVVWQDILFWLHTPAGPFPSALQKETNEVRTEEDLEALFPGTGS